MRKKLFILPMITILLTVTSCGKDGAKGEKNSKVKSIDTLETDMYGVYQAILSPVNGSVSGKINGALTLVREMDDLIAHVRFSHGPASLLHAQSIHVGHRCPTSKDDLNKDGFIDAEEGAKVYDKVIIPLDEDLNSQWMGGGTYPLADEFGHYSYSQVASYEKFINDLQEKDINPTDDLIKLGDQKNMMAIGKVVIIFGVSTETALPDTVLGRGRLTPHEALPIACGVIRKVKSVPGKVDNDHTGMAHPGGETIGGSGGGNDGADFSSLPVPPDPGTNYGEESGDEIPVVN